MNFLAHVFFADADPDAIVGQLCGDFVRGTSLDQFPEPVRRAIRLHRSIDSFTDRHPLNERARALFVAPHRRFAGIITDVAYDYFLASDWSRYSTISLTEYAEKVNNALDRSHDILPENLQRFAPYLRSEKILQNNLHKSHIDLTLERISRRRNSMLPLASAGAPLWSNEESLKQIFDEFFPQLIVHVDELKAAARSINAESSLVKKQGDFSQNYD